MATTSVNQSAFLKFDADCTNEIEVRNTFVEWISSRVARPSRRSTSAPPRSAGNKSGEYDSDVEDIVVGCFKGEAPARRASDVSTDDAGEGSEPGGSFTGSVEAPPSPQSSGAEAASSPPPPPCASAELKRSPLSSKAKAWQPPLDKEVAAKPVAPSPFEAEVTATLDSAVASARSAELVVHSEVVMDAASGRCSVTLAMAPQEIHKFEQLLTLLKGSLLQVASSCMHLAVMGYGVAPFAPTPQGFSVMLGSCDRPDLACWDAYSQGFCRRGAACCWHHPGKLLQVDFHIACVQQIPCSPPPGGAFAPIGMTDALPPEYCVVVPVPWSGEGPAAPSANVSSP